MVVQPLVSARRAWSFGTRLEAKRAQLSLCYLRGRLPVVTYATWRTSSTSVHHAIRASSRGPAVKAHSLHGPNMSHAAAMSAWSADARRDAHVGDWAVSRFILGRRRRADWVVLVRDPLAMAMSLVAMQLGADVPEVRDCGNSEERLRALPIRRHLDRLLGEAPIGSLDRWLAQDMLPALGWSALDVPFDRDRGWTEFECPHGRMLLLRADVPDEEKSAALTGFLGVPVRIVPKNGARAHGRGAMLSVLAERLSAHPELVAASLALRSARHFWHEGHLQLLRQRWMPAAC